MEYSSVRGLLPRMKGEILLYVMACWAIFAHAAADEFKPRQVVKPFPAIMDPHVVAVGEANRFVRGDELVLGVKIGNEARAYPINQLTNPTREIINDTLGGQAIAATW